MKLTRVAFALLFLGLGAGCRVVPVSAVVTGVDASGNLVIAVTANPNADVSCTLTTGSLTTDPGACGPATADAKGHATLTVSAMGIDATSVISVTAAARGKSTVANVALKDSPPFFLVSPDGFTVTGRNCVGAVAYAPDASMVATGDCTAAPAAAWQPAVHSAKLPLTELTAKTTGPLDPMAVEVTLRDGTKLTGSVALTKEARRASVLAAMKTATAFAGDASEPPANAMVVFPPADTDAPSVVGPTTGTAGGVHEYALVTIKARPQTLKCTYTDKEGKSITGDGRYLDGVVQVFDRHTQKVLAETTLAASGSPCDAKQKLDVGATAAKESVAVYSDADLDRWLTHILATTHH